MDCSPPGSSARGILQAGILEWIAFSFFPSPKEEVCVLFTLFCCMKSSLVHVHLFACTFCTCLLLHMYVHLYLV